jgi:hypothetical protein
MRKSQAPVACEPPQTRLLKRRAEKLIDLLHARSIRRRLNSYNFGAGLDYNFLQPPSIFRWLDLLNKRTANCLNKRIYSHSEAQAQLASIHTA